MARLPQIRNKKPQSKPKPEKEVGEKVIIEEEVIVEKEKQQEPEKDKKLSPMDKVMIHLKKEGFIAKDKKEWDGEVTRKYRELYLLKVGINPLNNYPEEMDVILLGLS